MAGPKSSMRRTPSGPRLMNSPQGYQVELLTDGNFETAREGGLPLDAGESLTFPGWFTHQSPISSLSTERRSSTSSTQTYAPLHTSDSTFHPGARTAVGEFDFKVSADLKSPSSAIGSHLAAPFLSKVESAPDEEEWAAEKPTPDLEDGTGLPSFERPCYKRLAIYGLICVCSYPFLLLVTLAANHKSIFWARFIVGAGTGALGFGLALNLLEFAKQYLEASTWATVIQLSQAGKDETAVPGILVRDLARFTQERTSLYSAIWLLMDRFVKGNTSRQSRASYDKRPWSLFILFYLFLVCLCSSLPFIFGRIIVIDPATVQQNDIFDETYVWGDLSDNDVQAAIALEQTFQLSAQWTLTPFASLTNFPPSISFDFGNDTIHFAESYASQLRQDGVGLGTFDLNSSPTNVRGSTASQLIVNQPSSPNVGLIQFPKWGIRIHCESLIEPQFFMIPVSQDDFTYIFVPDFFLETLFAGLSLPVPDLPPVNISEILSANDHLPEGVDPSTIVVAAQFFNNGVAHSFFSKPAYSEDVAGLNGWVQIEILSIRLNDSFTPNGQFPLYGDPVADANGVATHIGYDAAVCVEAYEPWIVETYNATGVSPSSTRIVSRGGTIADENVSPSGAKRRYRLTEDAIGVKRSINSTGKMEPFIVSHDNSIDQMVKDNARDMWYVPSPLAVSFTDGAGPMGYTTLSASRYAEARAQADSTNVLPFLAGSGTIAARIYPSHVLAVATVDKIPMIIANVAILLLGLVAGFCVPRLPLAVPRRGFDLFSWLAVLHGDNLIGQLPVLPGGKAGLERKMDLNAVEKRIGDIKVKYTA